MAPRIAKPCMNILGKRYDLMGLTASLFVVVVEQSLLFGNRDLLVPTRLCQYRCRMNSIVSDGVFANKRELPINDSVGLTRLLAIQS